MNKVRRKEKTRGEKYNEGGKGEKDITLLIVITMFCGTDNIP